MSSSRLSPFGIPARRDVVVRVEADLGLLRLTPAEASRAIERGTSNPELFSVVTTQVTDTIAALSNLKEIADGPNASRIQSIIQKLQ
jgi:hypothetical protein